MIKTSTTTTTTASWSSADETFETQTDNAGYVEKGSRGEDKQENDGKRRKEERSAKETEAEHREDKFTEDGEGETRGSLTDFVSRLFDNTIFVESGKCVYMCVYMCVLYVCILLHPAKMYERQTEIRL